MRFSVYILAASVPLLLGATLPVPGPAAIRPATKPATGQIPLAVPIPLPKPAVENAVPVPAPMPTERQSETKPRVDAPTPDQKKEGEAGGKDLRVYGPQPKDEDSQPDRVVEDQGALKACLSELSTLGARFEKIGAIDEGDGCGIENPVKVDDILPGLSLGGAIMRCNTALGLAHWLKNTVQPALDVARPGRKIVGITPGTTFACRLRNSASTGMISEHARGNAFDVAAFRLDNGETLEMKPRQEDHTIEGAFQTATTAGACLYFTTVLAPGSDASHETHMHADIKDRDNGYRICEFE